MPIEFSKSGKAQVAAETRKIKALQLSIRRDAEKHGDEHKAWAFQLDIYIEGIIFNNPECQKVIGLMDRDVPTWRMHAALDFAEQLRLKMSKK